MAHTLKDVVAIKLDELFGNEPLDEANYNDLHQKVIGQCEAALLAMVMRKKRGNQVQAARVLGVNRTTLRTKLKRYNMMG